MCLPFIALLLGELQLLGKELFERVKVNHVVGVLILVSGCSVKILVAKAMEEVVKIVIILFELLRTCL